jgi:uncharacterized protein (TIGR02466 family)
MPARAYFPTLIYTAELDSRAAGRSGARGGTLNRRLLAEALQMRRDDAGGRAWSAKNYPGGYTSYNSSHRLHRMSPTFEELQRKLNRHVKAFVASLELDLVDRRLEMTDCWVNIMPQHVVHSMHLHPLATISGTYYIQTPRGCAGLKFEDPRLDRFMAAPPRRADARPENRPWVTVPAVAGRLVLFESWLRHEVAPNPLKTPRVSVSFNYSWF